MARFYRGYKVERDDRMRWQGDTDLERKIIRINPTKSKKKSGKGGVIDTIVHEIRHAERHEKKLKNTEDVVYKEVPKKLKKLTPEQKKRLYRLISK